MFDKITSRRTSGKFRSNSNRQTGHFGHNFDNFDNHVNGQINNNFNSRHVNRSDNSNSRTRELDNWSKWIGKTSSNKFSLLNEITDSESMSPRKESTKNLSQEKTDTTNNNNIDTNASTNTNVPTNVLNYGKLIKKLLDTDNQSKLFEGDKLVLSFDHIQKMYYDASIYRIKLQYLTLLRKIMHLKYLEQINPNQGRIFKKLFDYESLAQQEKCMSKCLDMLRLLEYIKLIINETNTMLGNMCQINDPTNKIYQKNIVNMNNILKKSIPFTSFVSELFEKNQYTNYHKSLDSSLIFFNTFIQNINAGQNVDIASCQNWIKEFNEQLDQMTNQIISDHDPHINCDYCISITDKDSENPIQLEGINSWIFLSVTDQIDPSMINFPKDNELYFMSEEELRNYFDKKISQDNQFIKLIMKDFPQKQITIYYYLDQELPMPKMQVKILDLPPNAHMFCSILRRPDYNTNKDDKSNIILHPVKCCDHFFQRKIMNPLYRLSYEDYENMPNHIKNKYTYQDTNSNEFVVNYLFDEILKEDQYFLIKPDSLESFYGLCAANSFFY